MYSDKLIKEVKECYPDYQTIHDLVDEGSHFLGRYIDGTLGAVAVDTILTATTLEELQVEARFIKRKINCFKMWQLEDPRNK